MTLARLEGDWWPESLPDNIRIGERTYFYSSYAFMHYRSAEPVGVSIGDDTGIYEGTSFVLGPGGTFEIGRFGTVIDTIVCSNHRVRLGDFVFVAHGVVMADTFAAIPGTRERRKAFSAPPWLLSETAAVRDRTRDILIGENVWIGARAIILGGADLGESSIVGAGSVVDFPVPPGSLVCGNPAQVVRR